MRRIINFSGRAFLSARGAVGGREEKLSPLVENFDLCDETDRFGMPTWEGAEAEMGRRALSFAMKRDGVLPEDIDLLLSGDLENQCVASAMGLYTFGIPYLGLYGACSTCTEGLLLAATMLKEGSHKRVAVVTGSHNSAAERQFRTPVEYGGQRTPTSQWTATAAGAFILNNNGGVPIECGMVGKVVDGLTKDGANMGCAMARAAFDSIYTYFSLSGESPENFDRIVTGDLGRVGSRVLRKMLKEELPGAAERHEDCGMILYGEEKTRDFAGASGCGCSAAVLACHYLPLLEVGELRRIIFISTGALMNPQSILQGNNILGVAPLISIGEKKQ